MARGVGDGCRQDKLARRSRPKRNFENVEEATGMKGWMKMPFERTTTVSTFALVFVLALIAARASSAQSEPGQRNSVRGYEYEAERIGKISCVFRTTDTRHSVK